MNDRDVEHEEWRQVLLTYLPAGNSLGQISELSAGASRRTLAIDVTDKSGRPAPVILQIDPPGQPAAALSPQAQATAMRAAAAAGTPVPELIAASDDSGPLGGPFLLTRAVAGQTLPARIHRDGEFAEARRVFANDCGRVLAAIHSSDLAAFPEPDPDPVQVLTAWMDSTLERRPAFELAVRWLLRHRPDPVPVVALHGDFRLGNLMIDGDGIRAVLDWELAHSGDPAEDLGWLTQRAWRFHGHGAVGGLGDVADLLASYAAAGGRAIELDRLRWWQVYATLRWGIICQQQVGRHLGGTTRSVELAAIGRRVSETEYDLMELIA